uniref:Uncharacterized protein n=1 Tax=Aegilops tauschii subsp. strangulata TaxID=200361 RepID=A0A452YCI0_AEGTS
RTNDVKKKALSDEPDTNLRPSLRAGQRWLDQFGYRDPGHRARALERSSKKEKLAAAPISIPELAVDEWPMADGGEMDEEAMMRAFFPTSFGKAPTRPSAASHSSTLRKPQNPSSNPSTSAAAEEDDGGGAIVGPPRPPKELAPIQEDDEEGGGLIGPPRPPQRPSAHAEVEDEDGSMVGPPRPPPSK